MAPTNTEIEKNINTIIANIGNNSIKKYLTDDEDLFDILSNPYMKIDSFDIIFEYDAKDKMNDDINIYKTMIDDYKNKIISVTRCILRDYYYSERKGFSYNSMKKILAKHISVYCDKMENYQKILSI